MSSRREPDPFNITPFVIYSWPWLWLQIGDKILLVFIVSFSILVERYWLRDLGWPWTCMWLQMCWNFCSSFLYHQWWDYNTGSPCLVYLVLRTKTRAFYTHWQEVCHLNYISSSLDCFLSHWKEEISVL